MVQVVVSKPQGQIIGIRYVDGSNLLYFNNDEISGGLDGTTELMVVSASEEQVELSFMSTYDPSRLNSVPLNVDKRLVMLTGGSGFYCYAIFEHAGDWPAIDVSEARLVFKLDPTTFNYMAVSDGIQRYMPGPADRDAHRAVPLPLAYKEAVLLVNPSEPQFMGTHYIGNDMMAKIEAGEHWKKVMGPVFIHLNSNPQQGALWEDAKAQAELEVSKWPYSFPESPDFHKAGERGFVTGRLLVRDRYPGADVDVPAG
ncbi:hypothetical protein ZWY2020_015897 [Hordeum vulgare]|nr:hypothetical protein ZWY2020_015897 [Hordeum vulgare]